MSIAAIFSRPTTKARNSASRRSDRGRRPRPSRAIGPIERFEERLLMTGGIGIIQGGTTALTGPDFAATSLANQVGFTAARPVLSADGSSLVFGFDNSKGTGPITINLSTYLDQGATAPVPLSTEVLQGTQSVTLARGETRTVNVPVEPCIQVDAYIESACYKGQKLGSEPIQHFNPIFDLPAFSMFAAPAADAGYNTTGFIPTATNTTLPAGTYGTLVSTVQTDNAGAPACPPATFGGVVTASCNGSGVALPQQVPVTLTGTDAGGKTFTLTTTTVGGAYSFSIPYADLPAHNVTVSVPVTSPAYLPGGATPGTLTSAAGAVIAASQGAVKITPALEQISGVVVDFGGETAAGYNFSLNLAACNTGPGSTGTTCFWTSCQGVQLIDSFNGGPCSTAFGNWLAQSFPHLAGCFAGQTNQQIACTATYLASSSCSDLTSQLLDTAFSIYATSSSLSGAKTAALAAADGFVVTAAGSGASLYNVGNRLAAFGGPTGNVSLLGLLQYVDANACKRNNACFDSALDCLFNEINHAGGIDCTTSGHDGSGGCGSGHDGSGHDGSGHDGSGGCGSGHDGSGHDGSGGCGSGHDGSGHDGSGHDGSGHDGSGHDGGDDKGHCGNGHD